jgi:membrane fusion protein (multidrug efflux system)
MRPWWPSLWVVAFATILSACGDDAGDARAPGGGPAQVGVVTIEPQSVLLTAELPGRTLPFAISEVRPQVSGILQERLFVEGSHVDAGQVLYRIDDARYRAAFEGAKARVSSSQAALAIARLKAERFQSLRKDKLISQQDHDDAQAQLDQAQASVELQQAELETARINLNYTRIRAPIAGKISRSYLTQGALVEANQSETLATIQTLDPIYVDMNQSTGELLALRRALAGGDDAGGPRESAPVSLTMDDGTRYGLEGELKFSEVAVDHTTGSVTLRAQFPNPDGVLLPGMFVRATIIEGEESDALLVPQRGVTRDDRGNATALIVAADGTVELRMLEVAQTIGPDWLVRGGIEAGDRVIVEGLQRARVGETVDAMPFVAADTTSQAPLASH